MARTLAVGRTLAGARTLATRTLTSSQYMRLPGSANNDATTPDSAALSITGDIDIRCRVALDVWITGLVAELVGKWETATAQQSYLLRVAATGAISFVLSATGSSTSTATSTVIPSFTNGTTQWIRATWRASDGRVQFFTASGSKATTTASDFTQLGTDRTLAIGAIFDGSSVLELGSRNNKLNGVWAGKYYKAEVRNGLDGTIVASPNFVGQTTSPFNDAQGNTWTVNTNGSNTANLIHRELIS